MGKLPVKKILPGLMALLLLFLAFAPAVVEARAGDEDEIRDTPVVSAAKAGDEDEIIDTTPVHFQEGNGEEDAQSAQTGGLAGTGIALGIIGLVLLLVAVVAVIGAVSLGIIGLGYWQSESSE